VAGMEASAPATARVAGKRNGHAPAAGTTDLKGPIKVIVKLETNKQMMIGVIPLTGFPAIR
jgi:hypothetical protein